MKKIIISLALVASLIFSSLVYANPTAVIKGAQALIIVGEVVKEGHVAHKDKNIDNERLLKAAGGTVAGVVSAQVGGTMGASL